MIKLACSVVAFCSLAAAAFAADDPKPATGAAPAAPAAPPRGGRVGTPNSNDVFYTLGPDSKPRDGVPKGRFTEAKVIPSGIFPGTQHTYWVYVPAQYDPPSRRR